MNRVNHSQSGAAAVIAIVVIVAVGLIGYLGYTFYTNQQKAGDTTNQTVVTDDTATAPEINSADDLDTALTTIDESDTTLDSESAQLDSQVSGF